jgi:hypothetical protein
MEGEVIACDGCGEKFGIFDAPWHPNADGTATMCGKCEKSKEELKKLKARKYTEEEFRNFENKFVLNKTFSPDLWNVVITWFCFGVDCGGLLGEVSLYYIYVMALTYCQYGNPNKQILDSVLHASAGGPYYGVEPRYLFSKKRQQHLEKEVTSKANYIPLCLKPGGYLVFRPETFKKGDEDAVITVLMLGPKF